MILIVERCDDYQSHDNVCDNGVVDDDHSDDKSDDYIQYNLELY